MTTLNNNSQSNIEKFGLDQQTLETVEPQHVADIDPVLQKQLLRKIDWHLLPVVWVMFLFSNLDRSNIGNAYAGGMRADLGMTSEQYSVALLVFFIGYCLFEIPSNMLISRLRPSVYLPAIMFTWGAVAIALAGAKNYQQLAGIRAVLGIAEAGFSPGVLFFLSSFVLTGIAHAPRRANTEGYRKNELAGRLCIWWTASPASGAIGGILAGGIIGNMQDSAGLHGWQWLFIIEGIATCVFAVAAFFILPDFPHTTKWLSDEEQELALHRLHLDNVTIGDGAHDDNHWVNLRAAFADWRTYIFIMLYTLCTGALTITYFIPTLVGSLGYTGSTIQYMTVPIYATCIILVLLVCNHSDYRRDRAWHLFFCGVLSAVSFAIIMGVRNRIAQYVFLCFAAAGIWSAIPLILVWVSNVITWPAEKRAIAQAATNAAGNCASIYGAFLWPSRDAPRYYTGFGTTLAFLVIMAALAIGGNMLFKKYPYPEAPAARRTAAAEPKTEEA